VRVVQDISKTDLLLSGLLNYFRITQTVRKGGTLHALIEQVLKENEALMVERGVQLFKKLEKNLPETVVPEEQLKYILNSVFQYAILSTPPNGNIRFLAESFILQSEAEKAWAFFEKYGGYVEISMGFGGGREPEDEEAAALEGILTPEKDQALELILRLAKGVVLRNWGRMDRETDKKEGRKALSLRFPLERRRMVPHPPGQKATPLCATSA